MEREKLRYILVLTSVLSTPWVVFLSSSLDLYLANQGSFDYRPTVLAPFFLAATVGVLVGLGILRDSQRNRHYLIAPWLFYLLGPVFVVANTLAVQTSSRLGEGLLALVFTSSWILLAYLIRNTPIRFAALFFTFFAVLVISGDILKFIVSVNKPAATLDSRQPKLSVSRVNKNSGLPNVYHVVLDGYQSDVFELLLDENTESGLRGLIWFKDSITPYANTRISIPSIFYGKTLSSSLSLNMLQFQALNSESSLLGIIGAQGYFRQGYLHQEFSFSPNQFDEVHYHSEFKQENTFSSSVFRKLWMYTYLYRFISVYFLGEQTVQLIESGKLSPEGYPIGSVATFRSFIEREQFESPRGRYVFIHLILPHPPYELSDTCSVDDSENAKGQYECANRLLVDLVDELRATDRYDDSMILIHADHGDSLEVIGPWLREIKFESGHDYRLGAQFNFPRSKALLLFKPFYRKASVGFSTSNRPTTLLDIVPTVMESFGKEPPKDLDGISLSRSRSPGDPRYFYVDIGIRQDRYIYTSHGLIFDKVLAVLPPVGSAKNNPRPDSESD